MRTIRTMLLTGILAVLLSAGATFAGEGIITIDHIEGGIGHDTVTSGVNLRFVLRFDNNIGSKCDIANGFRVLTTDGAAWDSAKIDSCGPFTGTKTYFKSIFSAAYKWSNFFTFSPSGQPDTMSFLGAGNDPADPTQQLPNGFNDTVMAIRVFISASAGTNHGKHICIDSAFFRPGGTWSWVDTALAVHWPAFAANTGGPTHVDGEGLCYVLYDPLSGVTDRGGTLPKSFSVSQNYPNPFNPTTKINFEVPVKSQVKLSVYNVLGQKVVTLVDKAMNPGKYVADWDGRSDGGSTVASGIYFYKFEAGSYVVTKKMIMLK